MNALLARYLDGDLTTEEATEFLDALEDDSGLEAELRAHERLLSLGSQLSEVRAPEGFTESVMGRIRGDHARVPIRAARPWRSWRGEWLAAAAAVVFFVGVGWQASERDWIGSKVGAERSISGAVRTGVMPASWVAGTSDPTGLMAVRFVFTAAREDAGSVNVAGSFNGWDPTEIPLHREGDVWSAVVVLPRESHEYMFVEDGQRWVADPSAAVTRDDGFGGQNAVLDLRI
jgi:anti-sigma factor RsiW